MAEENQTIEEVVLELKTNFETELRRAVGQYSDFQKKAGNVSRSVESNVNTMFRSVSGNLNSMLQGVQQTVASSINATRGAMRTTQNESIKLSKSVEEYVNKIISLNKRANDIQAQSGKPDFQKQAYEEEITKLTTEVSKAAEGLNSQLGKLSANASKTILQSTRESLNSIKELVKGTKTTLVELQTAINNNKTAGDVSVAKDKFSDIEEQMKGAQKTVKDQAKQVIAAEREMQVARVALMQQTDDKLRIEQEKFYKQTVQNVTKTQKAFADTERLVGQLDKTIAQGRERVAKGAGDVKEKIRFQIDLTDVDKQFKALMANFKNSVSLAGGGLSEEFKASVNQGDNLKKTLNGNKQALEAMLADAKALHATGFVDASKEIESIQAILGRVKEFKNEFREIQKLANFFDLAKWEGKIKQAEASLGGLQAKIAEALKLPPQLDGVSNIYDLQKAKGNLDNIESLEKNFAKEREKIIKDVAALEKEAQKIRLSITKQTNKEVIDSLNETQNILQNKANQLKELLTKSVTPDTSKLKNDISSTSDRIRKEISQSLSRLSKEPEMVFKNINKMYESMNDKYNKLSNKKFIGKGVVQDFKNSMGTITQAVDKYNAEIESLKANLEKLQKLQKMGLAPNSGAEIGQLKEQLTQMKSHVNELNTMRNSAIKKSEALTKQASKGMFSHGMDAIRNFRWQVAGFIYLITKAVNFVKNTFFKVIQDIQTFRTSALSIAASISYSLLGNMSENFNQAFIYSKDLMQKLELEAAKTILTLEDMTMLTKTFVQAGIIPKTDEDVRKISTIGTAIKILTEGMANAGVQMRQELYALIQGRQRAVDQVATMFSMIGINIQEMLDKGKKEGKSMIDVLSDALRPFEEVNKAMARDFSVQSEALSKIWDKIKRIGGDNTYWEISKTLEEINNSLATMNGEMVELTERGRDLAAIVAMTMESMRLTVKPIGMVVASLFSGASAAEGLLAVFKFISRSVAFIAISVDLIVSSLKIAFSWLTGLMTAAATLLTDGPRMAVRVWKEVDKTLMEMQDKLEQRTSNLAIDVENSIASIDKILKGTKEGIAELGDSFKLPNKDVIDEFSKIGDAVEKAKLASLSGVAKINEEFNQDVKKYKKLKDDIQGNIRAIQVAMTKPIGMDKRKEFEEMLKGHKQAQEAIAAIEGNALVERDRKLSEHYEKERQKIVSLKSEFESLMESMNVAPSSKMEAVYKKYRKEEINLKKFIEKNQAEFPKIIAQYTDEFAEMGITTSQQLTEALLKAFNEGRDNSIKETTTEIKRDFNAFMESLKSHDVMNPLARITNEMKKQRNIIIDNVNYTDKQKVQLLALSYLYEKNRKQLALIAIEQKAADVKATTDESLATILETSIRPMDNQRAQLIRLDAEYRRKAASIREAIDTITEGWVKNGVLVSETPDSIKEMVDNYELQLERLDIILENHKTQVQEPFWNDLKNMAQGWGDSLAGVLNEAAKNVNTLHDNWHNMLKGISDSVTTAWIKRNITDNLVNMLPSFGAVKGKEKTGETTEEATDRNPLMGPMKTGWENVTDMFKNGFDNFVKITRTGFGWLKDGLSSLFDTIMGLFRNMNSGGAMSYNFGDSGLGQTLSAIGGAVMGVFSGSGGGGGGGGGGVSATDFAANGGSAGALNAMEHLGGSSSLVFGNGGVIKEPVIGKGLRSGSSYVFGEKGDEVVTPMDKMNKSNSGGSNTFSFSVPVTVEGSASNKMIARLKQELEETVRSTTMRVIKESI